MVGAPDPSAKGNDRKGIGSMRGNEEKRGCGPLILQMLVIWLIFFLGIFVGRAEGAVETPTKEEQVAAVVHALLVAAEGNEWDPNVHDLQKSDHYAGVDHIAGIDADAVLTLDKPDLLDQVPQLTSLGTYKITAYCACQKCCGKSPDDPRYGITATGTRATQGRTIAADPKVLPYGTVVVINGHEYIVEDCGGAIKGNEIDLFFDDHQEAREWGTQYWEVFTYDQ